ncbi:hypothetical protein ACN4EG_04805 [Alkalinema pantanalense CENA528]|uniref:hypothetical protein n=1 Tax=Alkalinema pantanalense TaxID=1620705 RepID=UPI003D6F766F
MNDPKMWRMTGAFGLASVCIWLAIFPLYVAQPSTLLYDGAATAEALFSIRNVVFTRILLGLGLYVTLMVFAVGFRELIRRTDAEYEWVGTLSLTSMAVWLGVTLVANGLEGGAALDTLGGSADPSVVRALTMGYLLLYNGSITFVMTGLFLAVAGYATLATGILPRWTGWLAYAATVLCVVSVPAMYWGPLEPVSFYTAGGLGPAIAANFPPLLWFLAVSILLIRKRASGVVTAVHRD